MNTEILVFLTAIIFHSILCMNIQAEDLKYEVTEVPLQPRFFSNGKSVILDNHKSHRVGRSTSTCNIPHKLENSNLTCVLYPSKVKCIQTCMFGYTFAEGIRRQMVCEHIFNKWTPVPDFESCDPFIDCGVTLSSGGKVKCYSHFMSKGAVCEISCEHYEDKPAIPAKTYRCNIDGSWTPELPFCVHTGSGLALVPPPRR